MIACWYYRRMIANCADTGHPLPAGARDHIEHCAACRARHKAESTIASGLSRESAAHRQTPSPFLHGRIMSSIQRTEPLAASHRTLWYRWSLAGLSGCILLGIFLWMRDSASPPPVAINVVSPAFEWPRQINLRELSGKVDDPLENEMKLVIRDTRNAVDSLANSFLPEAIRSSLFKPKTEERL